MTSGDTKRNNYKQLWHALYYHFLLRWIITSSLKKTATHHIQLSTEPSVPRKEALADFKGKYW